MPKESIRAAPLLADVRVVYVGGSFPSTPGTKPERKRSASLRRAPLFDAVLTGSVVVASLAQPFESWLAAQDWRLACDSRSAPAVLVGDKRN